MEDLTIQLGFGLMPGGRSYEVAPRPQPPHWTHAGFFYGAETSQDPTAVAGGGGLRLSARPRTPPIGRVDENDALWLVLTNPVAGAEDAFNDWYDHRHIHDALAVPGFRSARRYQVLTIAGGSQSYGYVALFGIDPVDPDAAIAEARGRAGTTLMPNPGYLAPGALTVTLRPLD
ncbi:hypothetical protein [uncultured Sphingomonas sp.]|uniref:hypothetical protein n=1 Tax=uncultured Sphingomonas sp. TaxID=158754 RepID=UPI0035CA1947